MLFLISLISTFLLSLLITPLAIKMRIMDRPGSRKIHDKPIPRGGGIGIFIPVLLLEVLVLWLFPSAVELELSKYFMIAGVTLSLAVTGLIDDRLDLKPWVKLAVQVLAAAATMLSGLRFHLFGAETPDFLLTGVWIVGMINAINLIDGLDGLAAGVAAISCAGFSVIGLVSGYVTMTVLSLLMLGACLGFLKYNFRPARIFMGDTGSLSLGYHLAILGILAENILKGRSAVIIPVILLGIPLFDTLLTIARRAVHHQPIFGPDRSHFYNLLMDLKGLGHKQTVLLIYCVQSVLTVLSVILACSGERWRWAGLCVLAAAACFLSWRLGFLKTDDSKQTSM